MLTLQERALLVSVQDRLLELYVLREQANKHRHREHLYWIEADIAQVEAQREEIRQWEMPRLHSPGDALMAKGLANTQRRHIREKSVIDHVARELFKPKPEPATEKADHPRSTTDTGLSVEEQVRKEWDPSKGGLPTFLV